MIRRFPFGTSSEKEPKDHASYYYLALLYAEKMSLHKQKKYQVGCET